MRSRYVYERGEVVYAEENGVVTLDKREAAKLAGFMVMPDIQPYVSMVDGSIINSRSRHREHLREHGCVEVGNDSSLRGVRKPLQSPPGLKDTIAKAISIVQSRR